jgi:folate-binding protein YgfZ
MVPARSPAAWAPGALTARLRWVTPNDRITFLAGGVKITESSEIATATQLSDDALAWEQFRIEHGLPRFGVDYNTSDNPGTAGLIDGAVAPSKGCYLGQEVVCKLLMRGALRESICLLRFEGVPKVGEPVLLFDDRSPIGTLTSVGPGCSVAVFALGRIRSAAIQSCAGVLCGDVWGRILPRPDIQ